MPHIYAYINAHTRKHLSYEELNQLQAEPTLDEEIKPVVSKQLT